MIEDPSIVAQNVINQIVSMVINLINVGFDLNTMISFQITIKFESNINVANATGIQYLNRKPVILNHLKYARPFNVYGIEFVRIPCTISTR